MAMLATMMILRPVRMDIQGWTTDGFFAFSSFDFSGFFDTAASGLESW
jgi:hypothetical protein